MKIRIPILAFSLGLAIPATTASAECSERELPAGTINSDGTVAGETQALAYLKETAPGLYSRLAAMPPSEMRKECGKHFEWFQRIGNCRKTQKRAMLDQLKLKFSLIDTAAQFRQTVDPQRKDALRAKIKMILESLSDSELKLLRYNLKSMSASANEFETEIAKAKSEISAKRNSREKEVRAKMALLGIL